MGIWCFSKLVIVYVLRFEFSGHMLDFAFTSLRSLLSSKKSRLGNLDFFFVFLSLLVIFISLRFGLFDTSIYQALHDSPKKDSFKNA